MDIRLDVAIIFLLLVGLSGCVVGYQPAADVGAPTPTGADQATYEQLASVDGVRYDERLEVDPDDGLSAAETEAIVSRSMARVQMLRGLEFEERPDVELLTRAEFRETYPSLGERNRSDAERTLVNVQYEAMFLVGPDRDVDAVRATNRGDSVLGFYSPAEDRLVVVSETDPPTFHDELTLAHELLHALQNQHFGLGSSNQPTIDGRNAYLGLIEGEAGLVEHRYETNCESGVWMCVAADDATPNPIGSDFHFGVYLIDFFPYAEGPTFVDYHEKQGGWQQIDAMHDAHPETAAQIIEPGSYGRDVPSVQLTDRNGSFDRVRTDGLDHGVIGPSGLATMFAHTLYDDSNSSVVDDREAFVNYTEKGTRDKLRPLTYDLAYVTGWEGDRLHVYERGNDTAYVWKLVWNDAANASRFVEGHTSLVEYWGGEPVDDSPDSGATIWEIPSDQTFTGTMWIDRDGREVTIVGAPAASDLDEVYAPAGRNA
ncbi:MAG: Hvo_1808 family surface protein [Natronomonas sp.]